MKMNMRKLLLVSMLGAGLLPMIGTTIFIKNEARDEIKRQAFSSLEGILDGRQAHLAALFEKITDHNLLLAEDGRVVDASIRFSQQFDEFADPDQYNGAQLEAMRGELVKYYTDSFAAEYETRNSREVDVAIPTDPRTVVAQYQFIVNNPNPLGEKHLMMRPQVPGAFSDTHEALHADLVTYLDNYGYYDIFIVEPTHGRVIYSVYKELDYGTKLFNGPYRETGLATVARRALNLNRGDYALSDFGTYYPSYDAPAMFVGSPIYQGTQLLGALVFQIPMEPINDILSSATGLGENGKIVAVGDDHLMRSQSRLNTDNSILKEKVVTPSVGKAILGESGAGLEDFGGEPSLVAYMPASIPQVDWALIGKVPEKEAFAAIDKLFYESIAAILLAAVVVGVWAWMLGRVIYHRLGGDPAEILNFAQSVSSGDLRTKPQDQDRIGAYSELVLMREKMSNILSDAKTTAVDVRNGMGLLREGNLGLASRTEQQAANLEQTAASTEEITSAVRQNAQNARSANELAVNTRARASAGGKIAVRAVDAMHEISKSSEQIAAIIGVIDEIAFQTNLLALNAAVEAARAGEQGRGFAVVASEVRQLAGRSASAAREIKDLIESSVSKVKDGTDLVETSGKELSDIVDLVAELTSVVGQITQASEEQALGIDQINDALIHMDASTQQNGALVEQAAATADAMNRKAGELSKTIGFFTVDERHSVIRTKAAGAGRRGIGGALVVGGGATPSASNAKKAESEPAPAAALPAPEEVPAELAKRADKPEGGDVWEQF